MTTIRPRLTNPAIPAAVTAITIGTLAVILAAGLNLLGLLTQANSLLVDTLSRIIGSGFPKALPPIGIWLATFILAIGLAFSLLCVQRPWQRAILWITTLAITAGWAPVLGLASFRPDIAAPWIATLWSGICSIIYARDHRAASVQAAEP